MFSQTRFLDVIIGMVLPAEDSELLEASIQEVVLGTMVRLRSVSQIEDGFEKLVKLAAVRIKHEQSIRDAVSEYMTMIIFPRLEKELGLLPSNLFENQKELAGEYLNGLSKDIFTKTWSELIKQGDVPYVLVSFKA